jgi:hypothetical protein
MREELELFGYAFSVKVDVTKIRSQLLDFLKSYPSEESFWLYDLELKRLRKEKAMRLIDEEENENGSSARSATSNNDAVVSSDEFATSSDH